MTSRPINYYNLLSLIENPVAGNWMAYVIRYCEGYQFRVGGNKKVWNTSGASNLDELREQTKSYVLRRMKTDILDLPEKIISPVFVDLSSKMYDEELDDKIRLEKIINEIKRICEYPIEVLVDKINEINSKNRIRYDCRICNARFYIKNFIRCRDMQFMLSYRKTIYIKANLIGLYLNIILTAISRSYVGRKNRRRYLRIRCGI